nr:VOC family protein [Nocardioides thalensis]
MTAFLDFAPGHLAEGASFWSALTGYGLSPVRGTAGEFATLEPPEGDAFLRVQRLRLGNDRIHLDLHVADLRAAAAHAVTLGASEVADHAEDGYVVLTSPGGFELCFVGNGESARPRATAWPTGHESLLDQVCIDVPHDRFDTERAFWAALTGWPERASAVSTDFCSLERPDGFPLRLLFQRLGADDAGDRTRAHLDWATTDRAAETERHVALGAEVRDVRQVWTVLSDPFGRAYCITDRHPVTGQLT